MPNKGISTEIETRLGELQGWWAHQCAGRLTCPKGTWKFCVPNSDLALCISSIWLFLSCILDNETVIINIMLNQLYESCVLASYRTWGKVVMGIPEFVVCQAEAQVTWDNLIFVVGTWSGAILWDWPLTCGVCTNSRQFISELNCWTFSWCQRIAAGRK